ncbi:MAG: LPS export ABC transporter periplasmic protein LptC [Acidobacteria bacterium]|nr:LPS export ABC transporter periplasmic protein LptC [Acidobacteriota bacterium]
MARWQKRARIGVGLFGIAFAIAVYAAIGERRTAGPVERPARLDPRAILESAGAVLQQFREAKKDYVVKAERQLRYEDGTTKSFGVTIEVRNRGGRDFVVSGREMQADEERKVLEITGGVRLTANDGFTVTAERATFSDADARVAAPGAVSFGKGRMSGSGVGMTYNQTSDVLSLAGEARVTITDETGNPVTEFSAATAVLSRQENYLALDGGVRALRHQQVLEADRGVARLSEDDQFITFIELRGNARVSGGDTFDAMSARDIDLDYTEDGATLERVALRGSGGIAMRGEGEVSGRQFAGGSLDLTFAPDASLTGAAGRGNVRVDLPARAGSAARSVRSQSFDALGEAGKGLTSARFSDAVEYREDAPAGRPARLARSNTLRIALADDAVTHAAFAGRVRFQDGALQASAAAAEYEPVTGTLRLAGVDEGGGPRVADAQIQIEAEAIHVTLEGPRMSATGTVKTVLQAGTSGRMPGLLEQGNPVNVNAGALQYQGPAGTAVYAGSATLWQGETAVRGDVITIDRSRGDLIVSGSARSNLVLDAGASVGRAPEIRYDDAARRMTYGPPAPTSAAGIASPPGGAPAPTGAAQLSGPQGDLRAIRIDVLLAPGASRIERLEAYTDVTIRLDRRVATGDRLTYHADEERYVMTGIATVPVKIVEECRETIGRTVVFFKSADRVIVDGNEEVRTQSSRSGPCQAPPR